MGCKQGMGGILYISDAGLALESTKFQITKESQTTNLKWLWNLRFGILLELGAWNLTTLVAGIGKYPNRTG